MSDSQEPETQGKSSKNLKGVEQVVLPVLKAHGVELFDLSLRRENAGWVLRVVVDADVPGGEPGSGVTLELCVDISRDLSTALDVADVIGHAYTLEVSSPGVERVLRGEADFERFSGKAAKVTLIEPQPNGERVLRGKLVGMKEGRLWLELASGEMRDVVPTNVKRAQLVFELPAQPKKKSQGKQKRRSDAER